MQTTLQRIAITETFHDVEKLIKKVSSLFQKEHGGDFEDWQAQANLIFVESYYSYNGNMALFSTWLVDCIKHGLKLYKRKQNKNKHIHFTNESILKSIKDTARHTSAFELLESVKQDTQTVIKLSLQPTEEIKNMDIACGKRNCFMSIAIRTHLTNIGWTGKRIKESFQEIKELLNA